MCGGFMKYIDVMAITILFMVGVFSSGFSVDSKQSKKGIYYHNIESTENVTIHNVDGLSIDYSAELQVPGDYYELTFDVVNDSSVDMKVEDCFFHEDDDYIQYEFSYADGKSIKVGDVLKKGEKKELRYKVLYKNLIESDGYEFDSSFGLNYEQVL